MNKDDLLYHYFSNTLTKVQEEELNALLLTDIEFKKQFEFENNLKRIAKNRQHQLLKAKLKQFETRTDSEKSKKHQSFLFLKVAASIAVLITVSWFGYQSFFGLNAYDELYNNNFSVYPNTVYAITRSDSINSRERQAFVAYEAKDYKLVIERLNVINSKDYVTFYKAQSYLMLSDYRNAMTLFDEIINQNKQFVAESYWYMALIHIKVKDKELALYYLEYLCTHYDYKQSESKKLIAKLK